MSSFTQTHPAERGANESANEVREITHFTSAGPFSRGMLSWPQQGTLNTDTQNTQTNFCAIADWIILMSHDF
jgi:hypothetical protein